jgi:hypothetical protein
MIELIELDARQFGPCSEATGETIQQRVEL